MLPQLDDAAEDGLTIIALPLKLHAVSKIPVRINVERRGQIVMRANRITPV